MNVALPPSDIPTLDALERRAREVLAPEVWAYASAGAGEEVTVRRNRAAWGGLALVPSVLCDVAELDPAVELFGHRLELPVVTAPIGSLSVFHPRGAAAAAAGAHDAGTCAIVGCLSDPSFPEVQAASGARNAFQLYVSGDEAWSRTVIDRVEDAGASALWVTVDSPVRARRDRLLEVGFDWRTEAAGEPVNFAGLGRDRAFQSRLTWSHLEGLRSMTRLPLVVKGITHPRDARRAIDVGADAIHVSNHGGRELDHQRATIEVLPAVAQEIAGERPVIFDSGIRRGTDVVKALALGADVVAVGRLQCWGLAVGGAAGVARMLELLRFELLDTMAMLGVRRPASLGPEHVTADTSPLVPWWLTPGPP